MEIEVRPGLVSKDSEGKITCRPIFSRIVSLFAEQNELQFAVPGGLIGLYVVFSFTNTILINAIISKFGSIFNLRRSPLVYYSRYFKVNIAVNMISCSIFTLYKADYSLQSNQLEPIEQW